ncbi:MAG: NAD(P)-binding domain-containing protein [Halobacteriales archaeon]|nr:NAD(P)-binding domain-containing protein [Halobacteriales archaeon]
MRVGILGSGDVGKALGKGFASKGHDVMLGTRDPAKLAEFRKEVPKAKVGSFADAAKHGEVVCLAVMGAVAEQVVDQAGHNFDGKLLIDVTNPLDFSKGMPPGSLYGLNDSVAERVQKKLPKAKVVKAFNTVGNAQMFHAPSGARMMIAGNDAGAKKQVEGILREAGWGAIDVGGVQEARYLEALVPLWVRVGVAIGRWDHVFDVR